MAKREPQQRKSARVEPEQPTPAAVGGGPRLWMAAILLAVCVCAVYVPALDAPFIFDDISAILRNESITSLWPLIGTAEHPGPLSPGQQLPTAARPLVNLSFAFNYHFGEFKSQGYHAVNVLIHFLSSFLIFVIVRRALRLPYFARRHETSAGWLALAVAMIWALHPLQTEAVIYATQRTELMFALFYLATLYCSLRYWASINLRPQRAIWLTLAVFACIAGMASKEVMVSAPLMVLLFERTFIAGSLVKTLRQSWPLYCCLAATWLFLAGLLLGAPHSESAGFGIGVSGYEWWLTQSKVVWIYLKLVVWPWPLLIHYNPPYFSTLAESWMYVVPTLLLFVATLILLWRNDPIGYLGTWVFAILSPTLVIPIVTEIAAERRMYLPLAALVVLFVLGVYSLAETLLARGARDLPSLFGLKLPQLIVVPSFVLAIIFGLVSADRLTAYGGNDERLWREVLVIYPHDNVALYNLGCSLMESGPLPEAVDSFQAALAENPDDVDVLNNLGVALTRLNRYEEANARLRHAARLQPNALDVHLNLGLALVFSGRYPEAVEVFQRALQLQPDSVDARNHLGSAFARSGNSSQAIDQYRKTLELDPKNLEAHYNLGLLLTTSGSTQEASAHFEQILRLQPNVAEFHNGYGDLLRKAGRQQEAIGHYQSALRIQPGFLTAYVNLVETLAAADQSADAIATAQKAIEVARSTHQEAAAENMEEWLKHYQTELRRAGNAASNPQSNPSTE